MVATFDFNDIKLRAESCLPKGYALNEQGLWYFPPEFGTYKCTSDCFGFYPFRLTSSKVWVIGAVVGSKEGKLILFHDPDNRPHIIFAEKKTFSPRNRLPFIKKVVSEGLRILHLRELRRYSDKNRLLSHKFFMRYIEEASPPDIYLYISDSMFARQEIIRSIPLIRGRG